MNDDFSDLDIPEQALGDDVADTDSLGSAQAAPSLPAPSFAGAKPVGRSADGTVIKFDNGVIFNRKDQSVSFQSPDGTSWLAREGSKPVPMKPKVIHNAEDGKYYDITNPQSPKPVVFPPTKGIDPNAQGEDALKDLAPAEQAMVKKLTSYEIPMPSGFAMRSPYWQRIMSHAAMYDPTFDASSYPIRMGVRKSFTAGQDARNITSLNTAVGHLQELKNSAEQLNNTHFPIVNQVINLGRQATGDPRVVKFNTAAAAVQNELASVFKGTGATDQEINTWRSNLNAAQSPEQVKAAINEAINLMGGRLDALQGKYVEGMGKPANFDILNPKSKEILKSLGREDMLKRDQADKDMATTGASGGSGTPPPAQAVDAAKTPAPEQPDSTGKIPGHVYTDPVTQISKKYLGNGQWSLPQ